MSAAMNVYFSLLPSISVRCMMELMDVYRESVVRFNDLTSVVAATPICWIYYGGCSQYACYKSVISTCQDGMIDR